MSAVITKVEAPLQAVTQGSAILALISRANENPAFDVAKMERLFAMYEKVVDGEKETAFNAAMTQAQAEMGPISADATNPQTKSRYATYARLDARVRPIYTKHGFALSFDEGTSDKADYVRVLCYVTHRDGHKGEYHADMPADGKGAKGGDVMTKTHAVGAAKSYGKRYLLKDIFNIAVGEEDRDGNAPDVNAVCIGAGQMAQIEQLISQGNFTRESFLRYHKIQTIADIRVDSFESIVNTLKAKVATGKKS